MHKVTMRIESEAGRLNSLQSVIALQRLRDLKFDTRQEKFHWN